ncbi:outer membrane protein assembly factor BamE [Tropicimonas omnivorans]
MGRVSKLVRGIRTVALAGALGAMAACQPIYNNHGYTPSDADLAQIEVGRDTRETVAAQIGSPSATGAIGEQGYYYVSKRVRSYGYRAPEVIQREVVAISFSEAGTVSNVERFGLEDGNMVALSRRVTDSNIENVGFLRQLVGSIGNFTADNLLGN